MALLTWEDGFETGIDYIDYEHRRLMTLINRISEDLARPGTEAAVADGLGQLYAQVCAHFALEERLMHKKKYPLFEVHKADHEALLEEMRTMMDAFEGGQCQSCGKTLDECLRDWFHKHFQTEDARLKELRH